MHHLFAALSPEYRQRLEALPTALDTVAPLRTAHRRDLPVAIRDLSQTLTSERGALSEPYWAAPRLLSAYLRYFMPWNLVRLGRLLPALDLVDRDALLERPLVLDLGSGPLTLPLALWLARPDLRGLPLTFLCADIAPHPLEVGRDLLQVVAGEDSPWALRTLRAPMEAALKEARGDAALILAGNVMNELKPRRDEPLEHRMAELAELAGSALINGGRILVIEPGTRLGARYVTQFRRAALEAGLVPLAPCPHHGTCPLLEQGGTGGWCHFTFPIQGAPAWLEDLSRKAKLEKGTASLSFVLLGEADRVAPPRSTIRIISDAFPLPGRREPVRYACSERGLALLHDARQVHSGTAIEIVWPQEERRDRKSGALELEWTPPGRNAPAAATAGNGPKRAKGAADTAAEPGGKPVRGKAARRAAPLPDDDDDLQPAFLMEGVPQWDAPVGARGGAGDDGRDLDEDDGHDPSEPDGNRADGPDHGQTYGQMFANQPQGGRAAQRRGMPRFGPRRGRGIDAGDSAPFSVGFADESGGMGYGSRRRGGLPDDFGNRAEPGARRTGRDGRGGNTGMRKTGRNAGQSDGPRTAHEQHPQDAPRGQGVTRRPQRDGQNAAGRQGHNTDPVAHRPPNTRDGAAPPARQKNQGQDRRQSRGQAHPPAPGGRDDQPKTQGRPQRPFGNTRRHRPEADQEGRRNGRQQDGNGEQGRGRRSDGREQGGESREYRARSLPGDRPEIPHDRRQGNRQDRPGALPDALPGTPRGSTGQRRPDEGRTGKPRRLFDRGGKPGAPRDHDGRVPRRTDDRRPGGRPDGGQQRPQPARPDNTAERTGRGERGAGQHAEGRPNHWSDRGNRWNGPHDDRQADPRPGRRDERRNDPRPDGPDDRSGDDRPDNHSRRRKARRDD